MRAAVVMGAPQRAVVARREALAEG
jgi:hypothetical protein